MQLPFNAAGVSVTRTALAVAGQVFPLRDIDDVQIVTVRRNRVVPMAISTIGAIGIAAGAMGNFGGSAAALVGGAMLAVIGALTWYTQDVTHRLFVVTHGERREALASLDLDFVRRVEQAVRLAMASRSDDAPDDRPKH